MKGGKRGEERAVGGNLDQEAGGRRVLAFTSTAAVVGCTLSAMEGNPCVVRAHLSAVTPGV